MLRIRSLESKSESFASKLSLFEKLSNTEARKREKRASSFSFTERPDLVSGARADNQSATGNFKTAGGGRERVIVLASDGIAAKSGMEAS